MFDWYFGLTADPEYIVKKHPREFLLYRKRSC